MENPALSPEQSWQAVNEPGEISLCFDRGCLATPSASQIQPKPQCGG